MNNTDSFTGLINTIIHARLKYLVPREGQVKDIKDEVNKGRILVTIPAFGWETNDKGVLCYSVDKNLLSTVKIDDWVIVQFVDGNPDFPICIGKSTRIKEQLPKNYDGESTTHILFESPENKIHIKYDEKENLMEIGNSDFKKSARKDDDVQVTIPANTFIISVSGGSGAPAVGVLNPAPIDVEGTITKGSDQVKVGDK